MLFCATLSIYPFEGFVTFNRKTTLVYAADRAAFVTSALSSQRPASIDRCTSYSAWCNTARQQRTAIEFEETRNCR